MQLRITELGMQMNLLSRSINGNNKPVSSYSRAASMVSQDCCTPVYSWCRSGSPERGTGGGTTLIFFPTVQDMFGVLKKVLWQWHKCDGGRLEELAAASINSAHRWLVSGHSLLAEQQQPEAAVQVSRQPYLGSALPAPIWGSPYKRWGKESLLYISPGWHAAW